MDWLTTIITGLASAFIAYLFVRRTEEKKRRVEEAHKRTEQVRLKGTAAGETVLEAMADLLLEVETLQVYLNKKGSRELTLEEIGRHYLPIGAPASRMLRAIYATAMYTTPEIKDGVRKTLAPLFRDADFNRWEDLVAELHRQHSVISKLFHDEYLENRLALR